MPASLTYTYADGYLAPLVTPAREQRALDDVALLGTLPVAWVERLTVLRAYIIACLDSGKAPDDLFASKLKAYRSEYADALAQARAAQAAAGGGSNAGGASWFTIPLERA